jgi:hypothetical protein
VVRLASNLLDGEGHVRAIPPIPTPCGDELDAASENPEGGAIETTRG